MERYKKGDILVCVTVKTFGFEYRTYSTTSINVGEKYIVDDFIKVSDRILVSVSDAKTGKHVSVFDDRHFMTFDAWREFQLRNIL